MNLHSEKFMNVKEVAEYIGMKVQTIYNMVHAEKIPFHKVGLKSVRFKKTEIDAWIEFRNQNIDTGEKYIIKDGRPLMVSYGSSSDYFTEKEISKKALTSIQYHRDVDPTVKNPEYQIEILLKNKFVLPSVICKNKEKYSESDASHIGHLIRILACADVMQEGSREYEQALKMGQVAKINHVDWYDNIIFYRTITNAVHKNVEAFSFNPDTTKAEAELLYDKLELYKDIFTNLERVGLDFENKWKHEINPIYVNKFINFRSFLEAFVAGYIYFWIDEYIGEFTYAADDYMIVKEREMKEMSPYQITSAIADGYFDNDEIESILTDHIKELEVRASDLKKISKTLKRKK